MEKKGMVRFYLGMTLLVLAFASPGFGLVVANMDWPGTVKATVIGLLTVGVPELLGAAAATVLGKENFQRIAAWALSLLRLLRPTARVSKARYTVGLAMFVVPVIPTYVMGYAPQWLPDASAARLYVNIGADCMFIASLFVLGGDFWDKLSSLFIYESHAQFHPDTDPLSER